MREKGAYLTGFFNVSVTLAYVQRKNQKLTHQSLLIDRSSAVRYSIMFMSYFKSVLINSTSLMACWNGANSRGEGIGY